MSVDLQALTAAVFAFLASDSAGSAVRAALGAGATSVMSAADLSEATLPARPLVALRGRAVSGESLQMRIPTWEWWVYDDVSQRHYRINGVLKLIEAAYATGEQLSITGGRIVTASISNETNDNELGGLPVRSLRLAFYTRG